MPIWTEAGFAYEPYGAGSETFVRSHAGFPASGLRKTSAADDSARQAHFMGIVARLSERLGSPTVPVFIDFASELLRMDRGWVGHAVAAGLLEAPEDGVAGHIEWVTLRDPPAAVS